MLTSITIRYRAVTTLRERVAAAFPDAILGRWHDAPVGPHPQSMYQIAFPTTLLLASFLPWYQAPPGCPAAA
jgi:aromatic ring-cleaving dioxygenase